MTTTIKFLNLMELINKYSSKIDIIKDKHLNLLSELSVTSHLNTPLYFENVKKINDMGCILVAYLENPLSDKFDIIASGTIMIEPKLIREGKNVGHIEDIVVKNMYRGNHISSDILALLKNIARENDCYKIILDCDEKIKKVYLKSGFEEKGIQMAIYFDN